MHEAVLDGPALEKALAERRFDKPPNNLTGMVKASASQGHISFAPSGCESWVDIPTAMIAEAERIGHQPCKDHSHPLFRLSLKEPTDPQAKVLKALLDSRPVLPFTFATPPHLGGAPDIGPLMKPGGGGGGGTQSGGCQTFCSGSTLWCVCSGYVPGLGQVTYIYPCGTCITRPLP